MPIIPSATATVYKLTRHCSRCGNKQVASLSQKNQTVKCKRCRADLPPKKR